MVRLVKYAQIHRQICLFHTIIWCMLHYIVKYYTQIVLCICAYFTSLVYHHDQLRVFQRFPDVKTATTVLLRAVESRFATMNYFANRSIMRPAACLVFAIHTAYMHDTHKHVFHERSAPCSTWSAPLWHRYIHTYIRTWLQREFWSMQYNLCQKCPTLALRHRYTKTCEHDSKEFSSIQYKKCCDSDTYTIALRLRYIHT
jgi:hypothetical protein